MRQQKKQTELTRQAVRVLEMQYVLQQQQERQRRLIKENERRQKLLREKNIYILWYDEKGQLGHWRLMNSCGNLQIRNVSPSYCPEKGRGYRVDYALRIFIKKYKNYLQKKKNKEGVKILRDNDHIANILCDDIFRHVESFLLI